MQYKLQHKDELVANLTMDSRGNILKTKVVNQELLPLRAQNDIQKLQDWWSDRAVPASQDGVQKILHEHDAKSGSELLLRNCGLSLNDYYWIQPEKSDMKWKDVNLFTNPFEAKRITPMAKNKHNFSPAASTTGDLTKYWTISDNGTRCLIKGNSTDTSQQSLNEVLISQFHEKQGFTDCVNYQPILIKEQSVYCISENFANEKLEFVPAIQIIESKKKPNDVSWYEHYLNVCAEHGLDKDMLRHVMDYELASDFLFTNTDRHLNNLGILRDSDTLKFVCPAPIFDNGNSMFYNCHVLPDMRNIKINSFAKTEMRQLQYIQNKKLIDLDKLPTEKELDAVYELDPYYDTYEKLLKNGFQKKTELLEQFEAGKLNSKNYSVHTSRLKPVPELSYKKSETTTELEP